MTSHRDITKLLNNHLVMEERHSQMVLHCGSYLCQWCNQSLGTCQPRKITTTKEMEVYCEFIAIGVTYNSVIRNKYRISSNECAPLINAAFKKCHTSSQPFAMKYHLLLSADLC